MPDLSADSLTYTDDGTELIGYLVRPDGDPHPGVLLIPDASGVSDPMRAIARRIAQLGHVVLLADMWGGGLTPTSGEQIGGLIGAFASDRPRWIARVRAAHDTLLAQDAVAPAPVTAVGYCFGGASALEYLRHGGGLGAVATFHAGLDAVGVDWSGELAPASVLVLTGADDPMASRVALDALEDGLTSAGLAWEVAVYGGAKHGFTDPMADLAGRPEAIGYDERADRRSWGAFTRFLAEAR